MRRRPQGGKSTIPNFGAGIPTINPYGGFIALLIFICIYIYIYIYYDIGHAVGSGAGDFSAEDTPWLFLSAKLLCHMTPRVSLTVPTPLPAKYPVPEPGIDLL